MELAFEEIGGLATIGETLRGYLGYILKFLHLINDRSPFMTTGLTASISDL